MATKKKPAVSSYQATARVTKEMVKGLVTTINGLALITPWRADALDELEQDAIVESLLLDCRRNRFVANLIYRLVTIQTAGGTVAVLGCIAARRVARHGVIQPQEAAVGVDYAAQMLLAMLAKQLPQTPDVEPAGVRVDVEAERAPHADWINGVGQDDTGEAFAPLADVDGYAREQAGRPGMVRVADSQPSGNGRRARGKSLPVDADL